MMPLALADIGEENIIKKIGGSPEVKVWYAVKIFERDEKVLNSLNIPASTMEHIESDIKAVEEEMDDDAESIITNERYIYIASII